MAWIKFLLGHLGGALFMWLLFATVYPVILIMKLPKERRMAREISKISSGLENP